MSVAEIAAMVKIDAYFNILLTLPEVKYIYLLLHHTQVGSFKSNIFLRFEHILALRSKYLRSIGRLGADRSRYTPTSVPGDKFISNISHRSNLISIGIYFGS
jgi:hypothetical protein